ncbi:HAD-like domain-containing protein [Mycena pura]|uniref:HAD-like domain-containing protein n=1 Tax=Mycena pura TaxID=153505 RepID=A0AAD6Y2R7_9AGAR|nr:HAD-like domain-containing protein [Mycena pura]
MSPRNVEYVLLDVDGLLINSEDAYSTVKSNILAKYGKEFTPELKAHVMATPARESAARILATYPDVPLTIDEYLKLYDTALLTVWDTVAFMPGAQKLVAHLRAHGVPMALATGSRRVNYTNKTKPAHLRDFFGFFVDKVVCGDDKPAMKGKPEPDIFLRAATEKLGLDVGRPREPCSDAQRALREKVLVFEDGLPGMQAAKRAGMPVVWIPDSDTELEGAGAEEVDLLLKSLEDFVPEEWGLPPYET